MEKHLASSLNFCINAPKNGVRPPTIFCRQSSFSLTKYFSTESVFSFVTRSYYCSVHLFVCISTFQRSLFLSSHRVDPGMECGGEFIPRGQMESLGSARRVQTNAAGLESRRGREGATWSVLMRQVAADVLRVDVAVRRQSLMGNGM